METEASDWVEGGSNGGGSGFRAEAMRGMRADVREEKAGISRAVGEARKPRPAGATGQAAKE